MNDPYDFPPAMSPLRDTSPPPLAADEFISDEELHALIARGTVRRDGCVLRTDDGTPYLLAEAMRALGNISQETDPYGVTGQAETLGGWLRRGFVMSSQRIALGRAVYDAESGFILRRLARDADASGINPAIRPR